jgi:hypothetical protein
MSEGFVQFFFGVQKRDDMYTHTNDAGYIFYVPERVTALPNRITYTKFPKYRSGWSFYLPWRDSRTTKMIVYTSTGEEDFVMECSSGLKDLWLTIKPYPYTSFKLKDFDGQTIIVKTKLLEHTRSVGDGKFKWLSWFFKNNVSKYLELEFDKEVGKEKGSWKGGTLGCSVDATGCKTPEEAIKKFCKEGSTFISNMEYICAID